MITSKVIAPAAKLAIVGTLHRVSSSRWVSVIKGKIVFIDTPNPLPQHEANAVLEVAQALGMGRTITLEVLLSPKRVLKQNRRTRRPKTTKGKKHILQD